MNVRTRKTLCSWRKYNKTLTNYPITLLSIIFFVNLKYNSLISNKIRLGNHVAFLKCVLLHPNQNRDICIYRIIFFHADNKLSAEEIFRASCGQVQRQNQDRSPSF